MRASFFLAAAILAAGAAWAGEAQPRTITTTGEAYAAMVPDIVKIDIGVETTDKVTVKAVAANNVLMAKVVEAIKASGVPEKAMQTSLFSISARHPPTKEGYGFDYAVTTGYTVSNTLSITIEDVSKAPLVLDAAVKAGANTSNSVMFLAKDQTALADKVLAEAMKNARHNAEIMAAAEGAKVGKVITIARAAAPENDYLPRLAPMHKDKLGAPPPPLLGGEVSVSDSVTVTFTLE